MVQAFLLAFLTLTGWITVPYILVLSFFLGFVNAFDIPNRQAFIVEMVERREDLGNAIALNSSLFNGARMIGPSIAGILISLLGEGICFLLNGISFIAVIIALLAMKVSPHPKESKEIRVWQGIKEGFSYAFGFPPIRYIIFFIGWISFVGMLYTTLMPVFAKSILQGGPKTYGFLMSAAGIGALIGALSLAVRKSVIGLGKMIVVSSSLFGIGLICFSLSSVLWLSLLLMLIVGFGMMVHMASSNTIIQTMVEDDKRGRVMSFYVMAFAGMSPIGSLVGGSLASQIGAPHTLIIGGALCLLGSFMFARKLPSIRKMIRPIYIKKGILSEKPAMETGHDH
jgi:MFS family permease